MEVGRVMRRVTSPSTLTETVLTLRVPDGLVPRAPPAAGQPARRPEGTDDGSKQTGARWALPLHLRRDVNPVCEFYCSLYRSNREHRELQRDENVPAAA